MTRIKLRARVRTALPVAGRAVDEYREIRRKYGEFAETWRDYTGRKEAVLASWLHAARTRLAPRKTVLFYPSLPQPYAVMYRLCVVSGYRMVSDRGVQHDYAIRWIDTTVPGPAADKIVESYLNGLCNDISKTLVSKKFASTFGYDLLVDPTKYNGKVVEKSDSNATHDGKVIKCPIPANSVKPGFVYQKEIVSVTDDNEYYYEYRVPIFEDVIPAVYIKYRQKEARFKSFSHADISDPKGIFSNREIKLIKLFCQSIDLSYGELDVLRDKKSKKLYIVDANNTPSGPTRGFTPRQRIEALKSLLPTFENMINRESIA